MGVVGWEVGGWVGWWVGGRAMCWLACLFIEREGDKEREGCGERGREVEKLGCGM